VRKAPRVRAHSATLRAMRGSRHAGQNAAEHQAAALLILDLGPRCHALPKQVGSRSHSIVQVVEAERVLTILDNS
jgi:hypothetical protein